MTDDPRDILKALDVECHEVRVFCVYLDDYREKGYAAFTSEFAMELADSAVLALARLVVKYKWQRDDMAEYVAAHDDEAAPGVIAASDARWQARDA